jgi:hypothetical protein
MSAKSISYKGSQGNLREVIPTGGPEGRCEARFRGEHLGYYENQNLAEKAIQAALRAHLDGGKRNG